MKIIFLVMMWFSFSLASVVVDDKTGLMWQDSDEAASVNTTWSEANAYCEKLSLDTYKDWYLPTYEQLQTIVDKSRYNPAINKKFKNVTPGNYWSSSADKIFAKNAWNVDFKFGFSYDTDKTNHYYVRCARGDVPKK